MKKIIALLITGVLVALISPVALAANLNFTGQIKSEMNYNLDPVSGRNWNGGSRLELGASLGDDLQAGLSIVGLERSFIGQWFNDKGYDGVLPVPGREIETDNNKIGIDGLWVQSKGSLWTNGPELTTRVGNLDVNYSPLIADVEDPGVSVEAQAGPITVGAFNAWKDGEPGHGGRVAVAPSDAVKLGGTFVKVQNQEAFAVDGQLKPTEALTVEGTFAQVVNAGNAAMVGGSYQVAEKLALRAGYRNLETGFQPLWRNTDMTTDIRGGLEAVNPVTDYYGEKGYNVGATAEIASFVVEGDYDQYTQQLDGTENREIKASIARAFDLAGNQITAKLSGTYELETSEREELDANLKYTAPNGLAVEINHDFVAEETTATAGFDTRF